MILPEESRTKYILVVIAVFIILIVASFVYQQKKIMNLENKISGKSGTAKQQSDGSEFTAKSSAARAIQETITENTKEIRGNVTAKNEGSLSINAEVVDFSKFSEIENNVLGQADSLPKTKKMFTVKINADTQFPAMKLQEINIGDEVFVFTDNLIYKTSDLTASKILMVSAAVSDLKLKNPANLDLGEYIKQDSTIAGPIKEVGNNYFIIEANWIDYSKIDYSQATNIGNMDPSSVPKITKQYKVSVDDKTTYVKSKFNELKVGDITQAFSSRPTSSASEFTAIKIDGPLQPPK